MTKNEFKQKALIHVAAALVKVMDEKADGVLDNEAAHYDIAGNAVRIVNALTEYASDPMTDEPIWFDEEDDEEDDEDDGE